jgi:hypothetical protein
LVDRRHKNGTTIHRVRRVIDKQELIAGLECRDPVGSFGLVPHSMNQEDAARAAIRCHVRLCDKFNGVASTSSAGPSKQLELIGPGVQTQGV